LNKADLMSADERRGVVGEIGRVVSRSVKIVEVENGRVSPAVLLGLGVAAEDDIANRKSHHDTEAGHDHDDFESFVIDLRRFETPQTLIAKIADAAAKHDILRVKGFVEIAGKPMRLLIQGVGSRIQHRFDRAWHKDENRCSRLVVIGQKGLDAEAVRNLILG
jgi:cobalamin biosynthesis protein CobW